MDEGMLTPDSLDGFLQAMQQTGSEQKSPAQTLQEALAAPAPQITLPERQAPDTSSLAPLALLTMGASLAGRRRPGQNMTSHFLDSALRATQFAAQGKQDLEKQASDRYAQDLQAAEIKQKLEAGAINNKGAAVNLAVATASAPLNLEMLQSKIKDAASAADASATQAKVARIRSAYADEVAKAELALSNAKTAHEQAAASAALSNAQANLRSADAAMVTANSHMKRMENESAIIAEGKKTGEIKQIGTALPGDPIKVELRDTTGRVIASQLPMSGGEADTFLARQYKELDKQGLVTGTLKEYVAANRNDLISPPSYRAWLDERMKTRTPGTGGAVVEGAGMSPAGGAFGPGAGVGPDGKPIVPNDKVTEAAKNLGVLAGVKPGQIAINNATGEVVDHTGMVLSKQAAMAKLNMNEATFDKKYPQLAKNPRYASQPAAGVTPVNMANQTAQLYAAAHAGLEAVKAQAPGPFERMQARAQGGPAAEQALVAAHAARVAQVQQEVDRLRTAYENAAQGQGAMQ